MKTWECTATCGFKTTSVRGWKQHVEVCEKRRERLRAVENRLRASEAGQALAALGVDVVKELRIFAKVKP